MTALLFAGSLHADTSKDWSSVSPAERAAAYEPKNARAGVATVRQAMTAADPSGALGFEVDSDTEAMRGTFRITVPVLDVRGRIAPNRFALYYKARMWFGGNSMADLDGDLVGAPGWSLGIPKIVGGILIEADGTRRPARKIAGVGNASEDVEASYVTTDGSNIRYEIRLRPRRNFLDFGGAVGEVRYPDGSLTVMEGQSGNKPGGGPSVLYSSLSAKDIVDVAGNVTSVEYRGGEFGSWIAFPQSITDPLGRVIRFHYDSNSLLVAITVEVPGEATRTLVRLTYRSILYYSKIDEQSPSRDQQTQTSVLQGIYFPADASGYWFGDADSYNGYAMLRKVVKKTQMSFASSGLTNGGTLTSGSTVRERVYDLPMDPPASGDRLDFPKYTRMTETIAGVQGSLVTNYLVLEQPNESIVVVTLPDGSLRGTVIDKQSGMPRSRGTNAPSGATTSLSEYNWNSGRDGVWRLEKLVETDSLGRKKYTTYGFNTTGQVQNVKFYDWVDAAQISNAPMLRWVKYEYLNDLAYTQRGIRNLISRMEVYGAGSLHPEERTDFGYDNGPRKAMRGIDRNALFTPGFRSDLATLMGPLAASKAGLQTSVSRWVTPAQSSSPIVRTDIRYTESGALAEVSVDGVRTIAYQYSSRGRFGLPDSVTRGSGRRNTLTTNIKWNIGLGEPKEVYGIGQPKLTLAHDDAQRLLKVVSSTGGEMERIYLPDALTTVDVRRQRGQVRQIVRMFNDGRGLPARIDAVLPGKLPVVSLYEYDVKGRVTRTAPAHVSGSAPNWLKLEYDAEGRVTSTQQENGSIERTNFDRSSLPIQVIPTGTVRLETDAWQRQRFIVTDALDRTVQVLTPVVGSPGSWSATSYAYDARSNLLTVYSDLNQSGLAIAGRRFAYDGLSRRTHQHLIERSPRLNDAGVVSLNGSWSDVFSYDNLSNLVRHVDPRGVQVRYEYGRDGLKRLRGIQAVLPPVVSTQPSVAITPSVKFSYSTAGDPLRMDAAQVTGIVEQTYAYDPLYRFTDISTRFVGHDLINQHVRRDSDGRIERFELAVGWGQTVVDIRYGYGGDGRRISLEDWNQGRRGFRVEAQFDTLGVLSGYTYQAGGWNANESFNVDPGFQRITGHKIEVNGQKVVDEAYVFNALGVSQASGAISLNLPDKSATGQLRGIRDQISNSFSEIDYDKLGRLSGVFNGPVGPSRKLSLTGFTYSYDLAGNRTNSRAFEIQLGLLPLDGGYIQRDLGASAADGLTDLQFDPLTNRISTPGFEYDAAGNLTRLPRKDGSVLLLAYDGFGRLSSVEREGQGNVERYSYGLGPTRVIVESTGQPRRFFVWSGLSKTAEFTDGGVGRRLVFKSAVQKLIDREVVRLTGSGSSRKIEFFHTTSTKRFESSPHARFTSLGTKPYGSNANSAYNEKAFHTYDRSRFGIDDALNRAYDPETGRFLQPDPLGVVAFSLSDPQTLNLFAFVRNDPINLRDPLGLDACSAGGVPTPLDDGGTLCTYAYPQAVFETVVHARKGDGSAIISDWGFGRIPWTLYNTWVTDEQFQQAVEEGLLKKIRELREKKAKDQACAQARAAFAASANAYARLSANILIQNYSIEAVQYSAVELGADVGENVAEQLEDPSALQGGFAVVGRVAGGRSIRAQEKALLVQKALLEADKKSSLADLKKTTADMNAACK